MTISEDTKTTPETEAKVPQAEDSKIGENTAIDDEALEEVSGGVVHSNQR